MRFSHTSPLLSLTFAILTLGSLGCRDGLQLWGSSISLQQLRPVGLAPSPVIVTVGDSQGIRSMTVQRVDGKRKKTILSQSYSPPAQPAVEELLLSVASDPPSQGQLILRVAVEDGQGNQSSQDFAIPHSDETPGISLFKGPQSLTEAEPAVAIIQTSGEGVESAGIMIGTRKIPGIPISLRGSAGRADKFLTLFAPPSASDGSTIRIYAQNRALNTASTPLGIAVRSASAPEKTIRMRQDDVLGMISASVSLLRRESNLYDASLLFQGETLSPETSLKQFFGSFLEVNLAVISRLLAVKPRLPTPLKGPLTKPSGRLVAPFRSRLTIATETESFRTSPMPFQLREGEATGVKSIGQGTVVFNEHLGPLGNAVGVDSGSGLVLVYGLLESSPLSLGSRVIVGANIGKPQRHFGQNVGRYLIGAFINGNPINLAPFYNKEWIESSLSPYLK